MRILDILSHSWARRQSHSHAPADVTVELDVGQVFTQVCAGYLNWQIEAFYTDSAGVRHVRLREVNNRLDPKTLSVQAFLTNRQFVSGDNSADEVA